MYAFWLAPVAKRAWIERHPNRYSNIVFLCVLLTISILLVVPQSSWGIYLIYPMTYWLLVFVSAWGLVTLIGWKVMKPGSERERNATLQKGSNQCSGSALVTHNFNFAGEVQRKALHIITLITLFAFSLGNMIFFLVDNLFATMGAMNTPELVAAIDWLDKQDVYLKGLVIFQLGTLAAFCAQANCEVLRIRFPTVNFAMKRILKKTRRASEARSFGAHVTMLPGFFLASLILTWSPDGTSYTEEIMAMFAIVVVATIADLMAAIVGRKYGKHKWKRFAPKSIEGSLAGSACAFLSSVFFVGPILGLVSVLVFNFTDLILGKANISDNLTTPIALAVAYRILMFWAMPIVTGFWYLPGAP